MTPAEQELKSSLPRLRRYTGNRNVPYQDGSQWIADKRRDDNVGAHWRVHDKLYNLESFVHQHPGGPDWIELTRGTDITEAFESSHVVNPTTVEKILAKFYIDEARTKPNSPYTFKKNGFYQTLKRKVAPILKEVGSSPTVEAKLFQDFVAIAFILTGTLGSYWESIPLLMVSGLLLNACLGTAHNFFHLRDTWRRYYYDLGLLSSYEWRVSHVLSHHMYPNTLLDMEITMGEPMLMHLPTKSKNLLQRYGVFLYQHPFYMVLFYPLLLKRLTNALLGRVPFRPEMLLPLAEIILFASLAPTFVHLLSIYCLLKLFEQSGFKSWLIVQSTCSYALGFVALSAGHHHPLCFHDGDEARPDPDFGLCQLDTTKEKTHLMSDNLFVILSTFGNHPLHHLFPTICHSKLKHLKPIVEATLKEFGEEYIRLSQWQLVVGLHQQYARNRANVFKKPKSRGQNKDSQYK